VTTVNAEIRAELRGLYFDETPDETETPPRPTVAELTRAERVSLALARVHDPAIRETLERDVIISARLASEESDARTEYGHE
jgi:hypothetical protein